MSRVVVFGHSHGSRRHCGVIWSGKDKGVAKLLYFLRELVRVRLLFVKRYLCVLGAVVHLGRMNAVCFLESFFYGCGTRSAMHSFDSVSLCMAHRIICA